MLMHTRPVSHCPFIHACMISRGKAMLTKISDKIKCDIKWVVGPNGQYRFQSKDLPHWLRVTFDGWSMKRKYRHFERVLRHRSAGIMVANVDHICIWTCDQSLGIFPRMRLLDIFFNISACKSNVLLISTLHYVTAFPNAFSCAKIVMFFNQFSLSLVSFGPSTNEELFQKITLTITTYDCNYNVLHSPIMYSYRSYIGLKHTPIL